MSALDQQFVPAFTRLDWVDSLRHYSVGDSTACGAVSSNVSDVLSEVSCGACRDELVSLGFVLTKVHFAVGVRGTLCKVENDRHRRSTIDRSGDWAEVTCRNCKGRHGMRTAL
jgi:hypothetical protein